MNVYKRNVGFTLIELLAVVAIIGILITMMLPNVLKSIRQGQSTQCLSNLRSINTSALMCFSQTRSWASCNSIGSLETAGSNYFPNDTAPVCPLAGPAYVLILDPAGTGGYVADITGHFDVHGINGDHD